MGGTISDNLVCLNHNTFNRGGYTLGNVTVQQTGGYGQFEQGQFNQNMVAAGTLEQIRKMMEPNRMSGHKPIVVCGGETREAKDMDDAQQIAESLAHSKSADAYILKPVKKVAPKRDVVTTDL